MATTKELAAKIFDAARQGTTSNGHACDVLLEALIIGERDSDFGDLLRAVQAATLFPQNLSESDFEAAQDAAYEIADLANTLADEKLAELDNYKGAGE